MRRLYEAFSSSILDNLMKKSPDVMKKLVKSIESYGLTFDGLTDEFISVQDTKKALRNKNAEVLKIWDIDNKLVCTVGTWLVDEDFSWSVKKSKHRDNTRLIGDKETVDQWVAEGNEFMKSKKSVVYAIALSTLKALGKDEAPTDIVVDSGEVKTVPTKQEAAPKVELPKSKVKVTSLKSMPTVIKKMYDNTENDGREREFINNLEGTLRNIGASLEVLNDSNTKKVPLASIKPYMNDTKYLIIWCSGDFKQVPFLATRGSYAIDEELNLKKKIKFKVEKPKNKYSIKSAYYLVNETYGTWGIVIDLNNAVIDQSGYITELLGIAADEKANADLKKSAKEAEKLKKSLEDEANLKISIEKFKKEQDKVKEEDRAYWMSKGHSITKSIIAEIVKSANTYRDLESVWRKRLPEYVKIIRKVKTEEVEGFLIQHDFVDWVRDSKNKPIYSKPCGSMLVKGYKGSYANDVISVRRDDFEDWVADGKKSFGSEIPEFMLPPVVMDFGFYVAAAGVMRVTTENTRFHMNKTSSFTGTLKEIHLASDFFSNNKISVYTYK